MCLVGDLADMYITSLLSCHFAPPKKQDCMKKLDGDHCHHKEKEELREEITPK